MVVSFKLNSGWHVYGLVQRAYRKYEEAIKCYRNALKFDKVCLLTPFFKLVFKLIQLVNSNVSHCYLQIGDVVAIFSRTHAAKQTSRDL